VKIRGNRIELGEIELVLRSHASIAEACVVAREDAVAGQSGQTRSEKKLVAYYVVRPSATSSSSASSSSSLAAIVAELRAAVRARLPTFMMPSAFVNIARLPMTPNGKLDQSALPAPNKDVDDVATKYVAPRGEVEEVLAACCKEVLGIPAVGMIDNFFDIGKHTCAC
jgi:acyl-coenzyme A synthetase/AMP-(fatty) acid ligase